MALFFSLASLQLANSQMVSAQGSYCSLNGVFEAGKCVCDSGWTGQNCATLALVPFSSNVSNAGDIGINISGVPTWGGGGVFEDGRWHLLVGARAVDPPNHNNSLAGYPCDSKIIRVVSAGADPLGEIRLSHSKCDVFSVYNHAAPSFVQIASDNNSRTIHHRRNCFPTLFLGAGSGMFLATRSNCANETRLLVSKERDKVWCM